MNLIVIMLTTSLACATSLGAMEGQEELLQPPSQVQKPALLQPSPLKEMLIKKVIAECISVPEHQLPADVKDLIKERILAGREIDALAILKRVPKPWSKIATLQANEQIVSLSPNGKRLLAHHAERLVFAVYDAESGDVVYTLPRHCDCISMPLYAFNNDGGQLAFVTRCHHVNVDTMEIFKPDKRSVQKMPLTGFFVESVAINDDGTVLVCAGGSGGPIRMYMRADQNSDFVLVRSFGVGYLIALNPAGSKLAAFNHNDVAVYDLSSEEPRELYRAQVNALSDLRFSSGNDDLLAIGSGTETSSPVELVRSPYGRLFELRACPITSIASICFAHHGHKLVSLCDGVPQFSYFIKDDVVERLSLEAPPRMDDGDPGKPNGKFLLMQLHDKDTMLTACTRNEVYRFDLRQLNRAELRFAKKVADMAVDDVPVAIAMLEMSEHEYRKRVGQTTADERETRVEKEVRQLISPHSLRNSGGNSLIHRIQYPLFGAASLLLALCCVRN